MKTGASTSQSQPANGVPVEDIEQKPKKIFRPNLINLLNRINFRDGFITVHFRHNKYNHVITIQARPQICNDDYLRCLWSDHFLGLPQLKQFNFIYFTFNDGLHQIQVVAKLIELDDHGVYLELPETSLEMKFREVKRYDCTGIAAQVFQDGKMTEANLTSFSAQSFGLSFLPDSEVHDIIFAESNPVNVVLRNGTDFIYSGTCEVVRQHASSNKNMLILKPARSNIQVFRPKEVRSERLVLNPLPNILFRHPLTRQRCNLSLLDISGTGFAVAEDEDHSVLMPGMIIPALEIEFIHGFSVRCKAQVVYRQSTEEHIKCGVAILDMNMADHVRLSYFLHQAKNRHSFISTTNVDLDALWDFFFETGFIYPDKYIHIREQKERFQNLYRKLYNETPEIARHVIYQDKGQIYGHVSMFRYYRNTWLMHHHAALKSTKHKAGLVVMEHILQYINECHTLPSAKMKYIACYFRPNNKFAERVFGGAVRALEDKQKCSQDDFAYFHFEPETETVPFSPGWTLERTCPEDLDIVRHWYRANSGGLMLECLDLGRNAEQQDQLTNSEYRTAGFQRSRELFSLKNDEELIALCIVNRSDLGMNMSDLTNCIQIIVLEPEQLDKNIVLTVLASLAGHYEHKDIPVLLSPRTFADAQKIPYAKIYALAVLNLEYISPFLMFMRSLTTPRDKKIQHVS
ncbi:MAG TPA: hypothetical protein DDY20_03130 [Desulfobulbaceae bacterium]|nr:hypothetical protein [Desulfobulbaceae bacterium]